MKKYYNILGIDMLSSKEEIKKQYLKLMLKYHPDKCGDKYIEKCKEINDAYEKIMNEEYHENYDVSRRFKEMGFDKVPSSTEFVIGIFKLKKNPTILDHIYNFFFKEDDNLLMN